MTPPIVDVGARTDSGRDPTKKVNEDAIAHRSTKHGYLAVVCDGMGGHEGGKDASAQSLLAVLDTFERAAEETPPQVVLAEAITEANRRVYALGAKSAADRPGSTIVVIVVHSGGTDVAHVGDSRAYAITGGKIAQITKDHSVVQQMVDHGLLTPEAAKAHPDANRITRALGTKDTVEVEVRPSPLLHAPGDVFVLCTDGLSDLVSPEDILRIATSASPEQAVGQLIDLANARGGHDNVSAIIVRAREAAVAQPGSIAKTVAQTIAEEAPLLLVTPAPSGRRLTATSTLDDAPRKRFPLGVVLGLALVVLGLLGAALAVYLNERTQHAHQAPSASAFTHPPPTATVAASRIVLPTDVESPEPEPLRPLSRPEAGVKPTP